MQVVSLSAKVLLDKTVAGECTIGDLGKSLQHQIQKARGSLRLLLNDREANDAETLDSMLSSGAVESTKRTLTFQAVVLPYLCLEFNGRGDTLYSRFQCQVKIGPLAPDFIEKLAAAKENPYEHYDFFEIKEKSVTWVMEKLNSAVYKGVLQTNPGEADDLIDFVRKTTSTVTVVSPLESYESDDVNLSESYKVMIAGHCLELSHKSMMLD